jgi:hypothetical protein
MGTIGDGTLEMDGWRGGPSAKHASSHSLDCKAVVQDPAASAASLNGPPKKGPRVHLTLRDTVHKAVFHAVKS